MVYLQFPRSIDNNLVKTVIESIKSTKRATRYLLTKILNFIEIYLNFNFKTFKKVYFGAIILCCALK